MASINIFAIACMALGLYGIAKAIFTERRAGLKQTGILVEGNIFLEDGNKTPIVRFVTLDKEWITAALDQPFAISYTRQYFNEQPVNVYYSKDDAKKFYVDTKQSELIGRIVAIVAGVLLCVYGYTTL